MTFTDRSQVFRPPEPPYQERVAVSPGGGIPAFVRTALYRQTASLALLLALGCVGGAVYIWYASALEGRAFWLAEVGLAAGCYLCLAWWLNLRAAIRAAADEARERREINRRAVTMPWSADSLAVRLEFDRQEADVVIGMKEREARIEAVRRLSQVFRYGDRIDVTPQMRADFAAALGIDVSSLGQVAAQPSPPPAPRGLVDFLLGPDLSRQPTVDGAVRSPLPPPTQAPGPQEPLYEREDLLPPEGETSRSMYERPEYVAEEEAKRRRAEQKARAEAQAQQSLAKRRAAQEAVVPPELFQRFLEELCEVGVDEPSKDQYRLSTRLFKSRGFTENQYVRCVSILFGADAGVVVRKGTSHNAQYVLQPEWRDFDKLCAYFVQYLPREEEE